MEKLFQTHNAIEELLTPGPQTDTQTGKSNPCSDDSAPDSAPWYVPDRKPERDYTAEFHTHAAFETLDDPEREKLLAAATAFANAFANDRPAYMLTLVGDSGIGKTHLAQKLYSWARRKFPEHWYAPTWGNLTCPTACERYLDGEYGLPERLIGHSFVVIDDIGTETDPRQTWRARLQQVIDRRMGRWTVLTANLSYKQLVAYDARLASRLLRSGGVLCASRAEDYSITKLKERK